MQVVSRTEDGSYVDGLGGLEAFLKKGENTLMKTKTDDEGYFTFHDISKPDIYTVEVKTITGISFEATKQECDLNWNSGEGKCEGKKFVINGYTVKGNILSYNDPMSGVSVNLYRAGDLKNAISSSESDH